jgi:cytochrome P450
MTIPELDIDPFSEEVLADPIEFHAQLRAAGPIVKLPQSEGHDIVGVGRYDVMKAMMSNHTDFISARGSGILDLARDEPFRTPALLNETDPPYHDVVRKFTVDILSPRHLRGLRQGFQEKADELVDRLLEQKDINAHHDMAEAFPLQVIPDAIMGAQQTGRENLLKYSIWLFESMGPQTPRAKKAIADIEGLDEAIAWVGESCQRENVDPSSIGAKMWEAVDHGFFNEEEAGLMTRSLVGAGMDTTIYTLGSTINFLLDNPDQYAALHAEPDLAKFAFEEALRLAGGSRQIWRTPSRDVEVEGIQIRQEQKIMYALGAAGRDQERWGPTADDFDITRDSSGHLSLGHGIHACVGAAIARMEADTLIGTFARRVRSIERTGESKPYINNSLRGWVDVPMRLHAA